MLLKRIEYQSGEALLIKYYRLLRGLSQDELADLCGYTDESPISKFEGGKNITRDTRITLAEALNIEPWQLCKWEMPLNELRETVERMEREFKAERREEKRKRRGRRRK